MAEKAIDLFNEIQTPDAITTTLFLNACAQLGTSEALTLVKKTSTSFQPDHILLSSRLDALIKCGDYSTAEDMFSKMKTTVIGYGYLMAGFLKGNDPEKTLDLFNQMKIHGIKPNEIIYNIVISALSQIADDSLSQSIVKEIPTTILAEHQIQNCLIHIHMWVR